MNPLGVPDVSASVPVSSTRRQFGVTYPGAAPTPKDLRVPLEVFDYVSRPLALIQRWVNGAESGKGILRRAVGRSGGRSVDKMWGMWGWVWKRVFVGGVVGGWKFFG
ncbi:hypothetical protein shim_25050 [Shimia sp. SK013]|nr:hypothetical protein shim_25050 [Shimia sp. SK013]